MGDVSKIFAYHAHVYFDIERLETADRLRDEIPKLFTVEMGKMFCMPIGPHPTPFFVVEFGLAEFDKIVPWLMLNRDGLSVLVHPRTGDEPADHTTHAGWLGAPLTLDISLL
jgi:aromatic ring-cleaving dioxygenase